MKLVFITVDYPDSRRNVFPFVKALVEALADRGNECAVIAPYSITRNKRIYQRVCKEKTPRGSVVTVIRPPYLSVSKLKIGGVRLTDSFHAFAVKRGLKSLPFKPDAVYGHFWPSAFEGFSYCKENEIPLFIATGESRISDTFSCSPELKSFYDYISGVICVSSKNKDESVSLGITIPEKCVIIPNAVDSSVFKLMDKKVCRKKLNIPKDDFVIAFVGWFNNRKGILRVSEAIKRLQDNKVKAIFIGSGDLIPDCGGIVFKGTVKHNEIPTYLNAADIFVLPSLEEGCCNSIVEALSCGLPIISSDRAFNWDILDKTNSMLVEPENVEQISDAIKILLNDNVLRSRLAEGARQSALGLSLEKRAEKIETYIKERMR